MYILQVDALILQKASIHMDYLRIGDSKLKITLTEEELLFYGMDLSALDYASTETRRAFWAILDDAKHATGFDAAATKVCVQIYTSKTGGCEMFVTEADASVNEKSMALTVCGILPKLYEKTICKFDSLAALLTACKVLSAQGCDCESSAWQRTSHCPDSINAESAQHEDSAYYLYIEGNQNVKNTAQAVTSSRILAEFGQLMPLNNSSMNSLSIGNLPVSTPIDNAAFLTEHCVCLIEHDAVEQLSRLAV